MRPPLREAVALVPAAALLFWCRWPSFWPVDPLNPDEAQMLAQAITLLHHPIPWHSYDPTTSGPLNSMLLALPLPFVAPNYAAGRMIAAGLELAGLACLWLTLRRLFGESVALAACLLPFVFFCLVNEPVDWANYTSEHLSILLIAAAGYQLACLATARGERAWLHAAAAGVLAGALPFAKLQTAPILVWAVATGLAIAYLRRPVPAAAFRRKSLGALAAGLATVPLLILIPVAASGSLGDFAICYLLVPIAYVRYVGTITGGSLSPAGYFATPEFARYLFSALALLLAGAGGTVLLAAVERRTPSRKALWFALTAAGSVAASIVAIESPRTPFQHYLLFLVLPAAALAGAGIAALSESLAPISSGRARIAVALLGAVALVPLLAYRAGTGDPYRVGPWQPPPQRAERAAVESMLVSHIKPGDAVAIWGWMPEYLVATDAVMGTRDSVTEFQFRKRHYTDYYRDRYLSDFDANRPEFFLDAVAPGAFGFSDHATDGFENFPELAARIAHSYRLLDESSGVRLYRRIDS